MTEFDRNCQKVHLLFKTYNLSLWPSLYDYMFTSASRYVVMFGKPLFLDMLAEFGHFRWPMSICLSLFCDRQEASYHFGLYLEKCVTLNSPSGFLHQSVADIQLELFSEHTTLNDTYIDDLIWICCTYWPLVTLLSSINDCLVVLFQLYLHN